PRPPLFPYTTLFRSEGPRHALALLPLADDTGRPDLAWVATGMPEMLAGSLAENPELRVLDSQQDFHTLADLKLPLGPLQETDARSEEHTSELQSLAY